MPGFRVVGSVLSPGGHPRQPHSVLDDVEDLAVGESLCFARLHVGRLGIEVAADLRLASAVIAVTKRAVVGEVGSSGGHRLRGV